jgi:hypothetical protein
MRTPLLSFPPPTDEVHAFLELLDLLVRMDE